MSKKFHQKFIDSSFIENLPFINYVLLIEFYFCNVHFFKELQKGYRKSQIQNC